MLRIAAGHLAVTDVNDFEAGNNTRAVDDKKNDVSGTSVNKSRK